MKTALLLVTVAVLAACTADPGSQGDQAVVTDEGSVTSGNADAAQAALTEPPEAASPDAPGPTGETAASGTAPDESQPARQSGEKTQVPPADAPARDPSLCWDKTVSPATVETITRKVLVTPAKVDDSGAIQTPPVYRDETERKIVTPRQDNWFEVPCPAQLTPELVASVQRALAARGYYAGRITGQLGPATQRAIRRYQAEQGLDSPSLAVSTARSFGLWKLDLEEAADPT